MEKAKTGTAAGRNRPRVRNRAHAFGVLHRGTRMNTIVPVYKVLRLLTPVRTLYGSSYDHNCEYASPIPDPRVAL